MLDPLRIVAPQRAIPRRFAALLCAVALAAANDASADGKIVQGGEPRAPGAVERSDALIRLQVERAPHHGHCVTADVNGAYHAVAPFRAS
jgi:hypothetical protein